MRWLGTGDRSRLLSRKGGLFWICPLRGLGEAGARRLGRRGARRRRGVGDAQPKTTLPSPRRRKLAADSGDRPSSRVRCRLPPAPSHGRTMTAPDGSPDYLPPSTSSTDPRTNTKNIKSAHQGTITRRSRKISKRHHPSCLTGYLHLSRYQDGHSPPLQDQAVRNPAASGVPTRSGLS